MQPPSEGVVVTFYGDDFTGSTDVMETLEDAGLPTLLFLEPPTPEQVAEHPEVRAVGVAGISRSLSPSEMAEELPPVFAALARLEAPLLHYKICSTFDSAPEIGSIGRATELLREAVPGGRDRATALVVGVPQLGRWTAFGTLFAAFQGEVHRLDRHPAMRAHPITPMHEADVRLHLGAQTALPISLVDVFDLDGPDGEVADRVDATLADSDGIVVLDVADHETQRRVGSALHRLLEAASTTGGTVVVVGSSGVEYALGAAWGRQGHAAERAVRPAGTTLVVSGSRAPATQRQAEAAVAAGFARVDLDPAAVTAESAADAEAARAAVAAQTVAALSASDRVLLFTPPPVPGAPAVDGTRLSLALADITRRVLDRVDIPRLVIAGGDTSGYVAKALGIRALRLVRRLAPGSPLCSAVSDDPRIDGMELCLKGGQIGGPDYFVRIAELGSDHVDTDDARTENALAAG
ncbi:four-carbon acid sugar kinase family protein [Cnuibacter sp. UC19_7]|uniref:four-carbon acid sugar kinase family protein n=1 Tax=Cnuibacter sp. UC19_7 TaxID=3350166 RepID=UPI00366A9D7A